MISPKDISITKLHEDVHEALRMWYKDNSEQSSLNDLILFKKQLLKTGRLRQATNEVILEGLLALEAKHPKDAKLLRKRFIDRQIVRQVGSSLNMSESQVFVMQKQAITNLAQVLRGLELEAIAEREELLEERLPPPTYSHLIGVEAHLLELKRVLAEGGLNWVLCISGMGGIGKTSLADALVRQVMGQGLFSDFGWVSAQQHTFNLGGSIRSIHEPALSVEALVEALVEQLLGFTPAQLSGKQAFNALKKHLKERAHLIVIDNLETLIDVESLLPTLARLANPTKFLLTSRQALYEEPEVYHFAVPELSQTDTLQLIRQEALKRNLSYLTEADNEALLPIYQTVGGNPLALRLIIGQSSMQPLHIILSDLALARGYTVENLYTYIYRRIWDNLDEGTRQAFLYMPLISQSGADFDYLEATTGLTPGELRRALNWLVTLSLVDFRGKLGKRVYTIHNLTRTFLQEQVVKWQPQ